MTAASADHEPKKVRSRRRAWPRRPPSRRLDLTPAEIAEKEEEEKRQRLTKPLHVQMTPDGRELVERRAKAYGRSLSDFVRIVLLSDVKEPPPPVIDPATASALIYELQKIGGNVNQLAKHANETHAMPEAALLREVMALLKATLNRIAT